jgi:hypothetical protein
MMACYRRARVVINLPVGRDLNMRTFECAGARAMLVTGPATKLDEVLPSGTYTEVPGVEPREWANAVEAALRDPVAQRRADGAFERVLAAHTYDHRAVTLLDALAQTPRRTIEDSVRVRALAAGWSRWGQVGALRELDLPPGERTRAVMSALAWSIGMRANELRRQPRS